MKSLELNPLPCPFCGEEPHVGPSDWRAEGDAWAAVSCENDDCPCQPTLKNWANITAAGAGGSKEQKRIAVGIWNDRLGKHHPTGGKP